MRTIFHPAVGDVVVQAEHPGSVDVWLEAVGTNLERVLVGAYDGVLDALDALGELPATGEYRSAVAELGAAAHRLVVTSAAPGERPVPVFDSAAHDGALLGYARSRAEAQALLAGPAAYRAEGYGPNGVEAWTPA